MSPDERSEKSSLTQTREHRGFQAHDFLLAPQASTLLFTAPCDDNIVCMSEMTKRGEKKAFSDQRPEKRTANLKVQIKYLLNEF